MDVRDRIERILRGEEDDRLFGKKVEKKEVRKVRINGVEIEVPEGYKVEVTPEGKVRVVEAEDEDWEKVRKEFDKIDTVISVKDGRPVKLGGGDFSDGGLYNNPRIVESILREFGYTITPREITEIQIERARKFGYIFLFLLMIALGFGPLVFLTLLGEALSISLDSFIGKVYGFLVFLSFLWIPIGFYLARKIYEREKRHWKEILFG